MEREIGAHSRGAKIKEAAGQYWDNRRSLKGVLNRAFGTSHEQNELTYQGSMLKIPEDPELMLHVPAELILQGAEVLSRLVSFEISQGVRTETRTGEEDYIDFMKDEFVSAHANGEEGLYLYATKGELHELASHFNAMLAVKRDRRLARKAGRFIDSLYSGYSQRLKQIR